MPSLGGAAPSCHLRGRRIGNKYLARAGGSLASAPPSEGVHALVTTNALETINALVHKHPFILTLRS